MGYSPRIIWEGTTDHGPYRVVSTGPQILDLVVERGDRKDAMGSRVWVESMSAGPKRDAYRAALHATLQQPEAEPS